MLFYFTSFSSDFCFHLKKINDFIEFKRVQCVNDKVASTFVHVLVNMKVDREYLSPLQATRVHYSLLIHIVEHPLLY